MPFKLIDIQKEIDRQRENNPEFRKIWDESRKEYKAIGEKISLSRKLKKEKESEFQELLQEELKNPKFKEAWDCIQPELNSIKEQMQTK